MNDDLKHVKLQPDTHSRLKSVQRELQAELDTELTLSETIDVLMETTAATPEE